MEFKLITSIVNTITATIKNAAVASVTSLKQHTFKVEFPKVQKIHSDVHVKNQISLKETTDLLKALKKAVIEYKAPDSIKVINFPEPKRVSRISARNKGKQLS